MCLVGCPGGGVVEVEATGAVEGFYGCSGGVSGGQNAVFVAVAASEVDRETPAVGGAAVAQGGRPSPSESFFGLVVVATVGSGPDHDGVPDGDLLGADEDVFDEQAQGSLALGDGRGGGLVAQPAEKVFEVVGEFEVDLTVGELIVEGVDLVVQGGSRARNSGIRVRSSAHRGRSVLPGRRR